MSPSRSSQLPRFFLLIGCSLLVAAVFIFRPGAANQPRLAEAITNPTLSNEGVSRTGISVIESPPILVTNGQFRAYYTMSNQNPSALTVFMGASIRLPGGTPISDPGNDSSCVLAANAVNQTCIRSFVVPAGTLAGLYNVQFGVWSGAPGSSTQYAFFELSGAVNHQPPTPTPTPTVTRTFTPTPTRTRTPTPTRTLTPAPANSPATMTTPTPGSVLSGATVTFQWTSGTNAFDYSLFVGAEVGGASTRISLPSVAARIK